jgi:hypothetical protein
MLILKYFVVIGGLMVAGLMALNAHMAPSGSVATGAVTHASSAASLPIVPPKPAALVQPAVEAAAPAVAVPKPAKGGWHAGRSSQAQRRAH